jgi:hypothetical protein
MALRIFQLYQNGTPLGDTCANPIGPCDDWSKDPGNREVVELDVRGDVIRRLTAQECWEVLKTLRFSR